MKKFKTESQRILELMINSIYTNKEIFLRELISNASDALDKLHFISLTDTSVKSEFGITVKADKQNRTLTISDGGVGMNEKELEDNLGTIAASGTGAFKAENKTDEQLIGQFGVGFYSAFMVAEKIEVVTRRYDSEQAFKWTSDGKGYSIEPSERASAGTDVVLYIKKDDDEYKYEEFLDEYKIRELIKKYSDYIRYPIVTDVTKSVKEGEEWKTVTKPETVNSMIPVWKKGKDATPEELNGFYAQKYYDFVPPLMSVPVYVEGGVSYRALLYFPAKAPYNYYSAEYERGLSLYSGGVLVMENCKELLPEYLGFVRGVVDTEDVSLNISREILQKTAQLKAIAKSLEKKILSTLEKTLKNEREKYDSLFREFGSGIKFGIYSDFGAKKDELKDLVLFYSSSEKKLVTFAEYVSRMKEGQKEIYYLAAADENAAIRTPVLKTASDKGYEVLIMTDRIDEFVARVLEKYGDFPLKSLLDKDVDLGAEDKEEIKKENDDNKELLEKLAEYLDGKVKSVRLSGKSGDMPAALSSDNNISLEMERTLNAVNKDNAVKAERVLHINPSHPVFAAIKAADEEGKRRLTRMLYGQAQLLAGFFPDDAAEFCAAVNDVAFRKA